MIRDYDTSSANSNPHRSTIVFVISLSVQSALQQLPRSKVGLAILLLKLGLQARVPRHDLVTKFSSPISPFFLFGLIGTIVSADSNKNIGNFIVKDKVVC